MESFELESPVGRIAIVVGESGLRSLTFDRPPVELPRGNRAQAVVERLRAYFAGALDALDPIEVDPQGTEFQREVWSALRRIPAGSTTSYAEIARRVGRPRAVRAVGAANARNPVALVVPCHRVIAADGTLCGYACGLDRKAWLLRHEGALA